MEENQEKFCKSQSEQSYCNHPLTAVNFKCPYAENDIYKIKNGKKAIAKHTSSGALVSICEGFEYALSKPKFTEGPCLPYDPKKQSEQDTENYQEIRNVLLNP